MRFSRAKVAVYDSAEAKAVWGYECGAVYQPETDCG